MPLTRPTRSLLILLALLLGGCPGRHVRVGELTPLTSDEKHLRDAANQLFIGDSMVGRTSSSKPILPNHPWLVQEGTNTMHASSYASELQEDWGPLGDKLVVDNGEGKLIQRQLDVVAGRFGAFGGMCATVTFDTNGNVVTVCVAGKHIRLMVLDPVSLVPLAKVELPPKKNLLRKLRQGKVMSDTSGGAYFVLGKGNEPIIPTYGSELRVYRINYNDGDLNTPSFSCPEAYKISSHPDLQGMGEVDVTTAMPDYENNMWFTTRAGLVGVIPAAVRDEVRAGTSPIPGSQKCQPAPLDRRSTIVQLAGPRDPKPGARLTAIACPAPGNNHDGCMREQIQNSFVVGEDGVFVVSSRATYRLVAEVSDSGNASIKRIWSTPYAYSARKAGMGTNGSGTTPSLAGTPDNGVIVIGDNADPKIQLNIMDRRDGSLWCNPEDLGLFLSRESAVEDSVVAIAYEDNPNKFSIVVNNSYGVAAPNLIIRAGELEAEHKEGLEMPVLPFIAGLPAIYRHGTDVTDGEPPAELMLGRAVGLFFDGTYNGAQFARGIWRIDVERDPESGTATCSEVWRNGESVGGVMKLSTMNNVIYAYTREFVFADASEQAWYLTAMDFDTGHVLNRSLIGTGQSFYNIQGALNLCNGSAYLPLMNGLARARDHDGSVIPADRPGRCPVRYPR